MTVLEGYLERHELARELGRSERTISRWHTRRIGPPFVKLGRKTYYRIDAVRDWLKDGGQQQGKRISRGPKRAGAR